jgi:hypothetical protein
MQAASQPLEIGHLRVRCSVPAPQIVEEDFSGLSSYLSVG